MHVEHVEHIMLRSREARARATKHVPDREVGGGASLFLLKLIVLVCRVSFQHSTGHFMHTAPADVSEQWHTGRDLRFISSSDGM